MKNELIRLAKAEKISEIGFCRAEDYRKRGGRGAELTDGAVSIIVCIFGYYFPGEGNISRYARGADYHRVTREKMAALVDFLAEKGFSGRAFADTGPLDERLLARLSGLAFIGKNQMAINDRLGSWFFIGYILTDCPIEPDCELLHGCAECGRCIAACPLGALSEEGFKEERCLSYINQKKGELSAREEAAMRENNAAWGCDICQEVCPHNRGVAVTDIAEFRDNLIFDVDIDEEMSGREFRKLYGDRAFAWRGKAVLVRNQRIFREK